MTPRDDAGHPPTGAAPTSSIHQQLRAERDTDFRPDIEGLRAIAVLAVLLFHAELGPFDGGYVGVDVFFVVSGFLITRLLVRDLSKLGGRSLPNFWARRARRLLPASALVIVATVVAGWFVLDPLTQQSLARDAIGAAAFVANIVFARRDGDYFAAELAPSPLLHFWSLAVEEQFYLVWPMILLVVVRVRSGRRKALIATIAVLWTASFVASVLVTNTDAPWAFYLLPTRAWELLTGAAVAVGAAAAGRWSAAIRATLGWGGLTAVAASFVVLSPAATFPGWIALWPVAGTAAVILGGVHVSGSRTATVDLGPGRWLARQPLLWIGQHSYGLYLWHWPLLVLGAAEWGPLSAWERVGLIGVAVALSAASLKVFEDPIRHSRQLAVRPARGLALGAGLIAVVIGIGLVVQEVPRELDAGVDAQAITITVPTSAPTVTVPTTELSMSPTTVPEPVDDPVDLADVVADIVAANAPALEQALTVNEVPSNLRPSLSAAASDKPVIYDNGCMLADGTTEPQSCIFGDASSETRIVLFGDSHAAQWFPALHRIADNRGWRVESLTKVGCPTADVPTTRTDRDPACDTWRRAVAERLAQSDVDLIVMSSYRYNPGGLADEPWRSGFEATMAQLRPTADQVLVLGDTPTPAPSDVPSCLAENLRNVGRCLATRTQAVVENRLAVEREVARSYEALFAPTADWMCTESACPVILGDVLLYRDGNHISTEASLLLLPYLEATLDAALASAPA